MDASLVALNEIAPYPSIRFLCTLMSPCGFFCKQLSLFVALGLWLCAPPTDALGESPDNANAASTGAQEQGFSFLYSQMDRYHKSTIIYDEPEYQAFYPSGFMGDIEALSIDPGFAEHAHSGRMSLKISYYPAYLNRDGWVGFYFQYPDGNWGEYPGRDLSGSTTLTFWVRADEPSWAKFYAGGLNRPSARGLPYSDSFPQVHAFAPFSQEWKQFDLDLQGQDLSSVIGAFGFAISIWDIAGSRSPYFDHVWQRVSDNKRILTAKPIVFYLDSIEIDLPHLDEPRFIQSYASAGCDIGGAGNTSHVYDQSLALLALLARGTPEDLKRAQLIADALVQVQTHDRTFEDGRLRNAYASGELIDPASHSARLPGWWDRTKEQYLEDEFAVGTDTGNMAWAGLALVQAAAVLEGEVARTYRDAALRIAQWIVEHTKVDGALGGFRGGLEGPESDVGDPNGQHPSTWRSTEHNIDLVAFFDHLAVSFGRDSDDGRRWSSEAAHARKFVDAMVQRTDNGFYLATGTGPGTDEINVKAIPLDAQTWAVLGLLPANKFEPALDWALRNCRANSVPNAFDFNCNDGDGAWWEGTAQVAAALKHLGRGDEARALLEQISSARLVDGDARGAIVAASHCGVTTGFEKFWWSTNETKAWVYPNDPHLGATAWYMFALLGANPYDVSGRLDVSP